jgi:hypothetical protein
MLGSAVDMDDETLGIFPPAVAVTGSRGACLAHGAPPERRLAAAAGSDQDALTGRACAIACSNCPGGR